MSADLHSTAPAPAATEPEERSTAVPIWLIVLLFLLLYWAAIYFDDNGGWFNAQVYSPYRSLEEVQAYQISTVEDPTARGRAVYGKTCIACHQVTGLGQPGQFPPLAGSDWVNEPEPGRMIRIVLKGLTGTVTVKGQTVTGTMVPWESYSDEDLAAVITYVRQNKDWGNKASAVTPEQVAAIRKKVGTRALPFTPEELQQISPAE